MSDRYSMPAAAPAATGTALRQPLDTVSTPAKMYTMTLGKTRGDAWEADAVPRGTYLQNKTIAAPIVGNGPDVNVGSIPGPAITAAAARIPLAIVCVHMVNVKHLPVPRRRSIQRIWY